MFQTASAEFLLVDLVNELGILAEDQDNVLFSHSRKGQRDGPEKTLTGDFSLRQAFHAEKVSEDVATGRPCRH